MNVERFVITYSFSVLLLGLMCLRRFWRGYLLFFIYFTFLMGRDLFFILAEGKIGQTLIWYLYYSSEPVVHILRIAVVFNLYYILLQNYKNLKKMTNIFFFGIQGLVIILFIVFLNTETPFLLTVSMYLGQWAFVLITLLLVMILLIVRTTDISITPAYKFMVIGFLVYSGLQILNFFYHEIFGAQYGMVWAEVYSLSWMIPKLFWIKAAWVYATESDQEVVPTALSIDRTQVIVGLARLDQQAGNILHKIIPFWN